MSQLMYIFSSRTACQYMLALARTPPRSADKGPHGERGSHREREVQDEPPLRLHEREVQEEPPLRLHTASAGSFARIASCAPPRNASPNSDLSEQVAREKSSC